jgi:ubiquinone/menaquinone biosynthesis C-methylase UbiE
MKRTPEPELMLDDAQAEAYARADFAEPNQRFMRELQVRHADLAGGGVALDLGCGPGTLTLGLAEALPRWSFEAVDGSLAMLALGRKAAARAGLGSRVRFHRARLPALPEVLRGQRFPLLLSNSLLHHLEKPVTLWDALRACGAPGARVFVMDLLRPASLDAARRLVDRYASTEPELLRRDFLHSLCAAYEREEVQLQLQQAGLETLSCEVVSDRHWIAYGTLD